MPNCTGHSPSANPRRAREGNCRFLRDHAGIFYCHFCIARIVRATPDEVREILPSLAAIAGDTETTQAPCGECLHLRTVIRCKARRAN